MPDAFIRDVFGDVVPAAGEYGIALWMIPTATSTSRRSRDAIDATLRRDVGLRQLGWRDVPVDSSAPGRDVGRVRAALRPATDRRATRRRRRTWSARCTARERCSNTTLDVYASSCSPHVLIYKGMLSSPQLRQYFADLRDERLTSAIAVVHSRFSTNVLPRWDLAQPFRYIAHNGEINTVRGNRNWMTARETTLRSDVLPAADRRAHADHHRPT